jgi:hypothetical protein
MPQTVHVHLTWRLMEYMRAGAVAHLKGGRGSRSFLRNTNKLLPPSHKIPSLLIGNPMFRLSCLLQYTICFISLRVASLRCFMNIIVHRSPYMDSAKLISRTEIWASPDHGACVRLHSQLVFVLPGRKAPAAADRVCRLSTFSNLSCIRVQTFYAAQQKPW